MFIYHYSCFYCDLKPFNSACKGVLVDELKQEKYDHEACSNNSRANSDLKFPQNYEACINFLKLIKTLIRVLSGLINLTLHIFLYLTIGFWSPFCLFSQQQHRVMKKINNIRAANHLVTAINYLSSKFLYPKILGKVIKKFLLL